MRKKLLSTIPLLLVLSFFPTETLAANLRVVSTPIPTTPARVIQNTNLDLVASPTPTVVQINSRVITPFPTPTTASSTIPNRMVIVNPDFDISKIGQETWLNPQPEPPIYDSMEARKTESKSTLIWPNLNTIESIKSDVLFKNEGAQISIPDKLNKSTGLINLLIKPDFKISGNRTILFDNQEEIVLKSLPTAVYQKLNAMLFKNNIKIMEDFTLDVQGGKAVYSVTVEEPIKLLGIIPMKMKSKLLVNDQDGKAQVTQKPWYASISKEQVNIIANLELLPNLVVKDLKFVPKQSSTGPEVQVVVRIVNEGLGFAFGFPGFVINPGAGGPTAKLFLPDENDIVYSWYPIIIALGPGEEWVFDSFKTLKAECELNVRVEIANNENNQVEETTKEDNVISGKMECNQ